MKSNLRFENASLFVFRIYRSLLNVLFCHFFEKSAQNLFFVDFSSIRSNFSDNQSFSFSGNGNRKIRTFGATCRVSRGVEKKTQRMSSTSTFDQSTIVSSFIALLGLVDDFVLARSFVTLVSFFIRVFVRVERFIVYRFDRSRNANDVACSKSRNGPRPP